MEQVSIVLGRLREAGKLPRLIAFDLDYTLWSCYCEFQLPPFTAAATSDGQSFAGLRHNGGPGPDAYDKHGAGIQLYSAEKEGEGLALAVVSRTPTPDRATQLLRVLGMLDSFQFQQIYPGSKKTHFSRIRKQTGLAFEDMLFFDDGLTQHAERKAFRNDA